MKRVRVLHLAPTAQGRTPFETQGCATRRASGPTPASRSQPSPAADGVPMQAPPMYCDPRPPGGAGRSLACKHHPGRLMAVSPRTANLARRAARLARDQHRLGGARQPPLVIPALEAFVAIELARAVQPRPSDVDSRRFQRGACGLAGIRRSRWRAPARLQPHPRRTQHHLHLVARQARAHAARRHRTRHPRQVACSPCGRARVARHLRRHRRPDCAWPSARRLTEASADGDWFLFVRLLREPAGIRDLRHREPRHGVISMTTTGQLARSEPAPIVWLGEDGVVHALDAASRERTELARLENAMRSTRFDTLVPPALVSAPRDEPACRHHRRRMVGLPGAVAARPAVELRPSTSPGPRSTSR